jgi:hypothetical protein
VQATDCVKWLPCGRRGLVLVVALGALASGSLWFVLHRPASRRSNAPEATASVSREEQLVPQVNGKKDPTIAGLCVNGPEAPLPGIMINTYPPVPPPGQPGSTRASDYGLLPPEPHPGVPSPLPH